MGRRSNAEIEQLGNYQSQISAAKKFRRDEGYDDLWRRLVDLYRGKQFTNLSTEDRVLVNIAFSTVNVIAPSVSVNYPKITVNARRPEHGPMAMFAEQLVNYQWRRFGVRPEFRLAVKDFLVVGHGWIKCGYRFVEEAEVGSDEDPSDPDAPDVITSTSVVLEDRPFAERVSFEDMFVDPDATSLRDARWISQRIRRTLSEVWSDDNYERGARENLKSGYSTGNVEDQQTDHRQVRDPNQKYVDVYEHYNLVTNTMCVFADGCSHFLVKPRPMPYSFGHPYVMIRNYDVPDHFYPMGDLEAIEPLQRELNALRTQMVNHRKQFARKYLIDKSGFSSDGLKALESDVDNTMVPVKDGKDLGDVLKVMPSHNVPADFYNQSGMVMQDANTVSGVTEYQRGEMGEIRRTATEAAITQDSANARAADKLAQIEQAIAAVGERLVQLSQEFMTGEQVIPIVGPQGRAWVPIDADYIKGQFDFEVEGGSTAPVNESFRRQTALQMVDAMAPFIQLGVVNPMALAQHLLQFGFGIKDPEKFLGSGVPPMPPEGELGAPPPDMGGVPLPPMGPGMGGGQVPSTVDPATLAALASRVGLDPGSLAA